MEQRVIVQLEEAARKIADENEIDRLVALDEAYVKDKSRAVSRKQEFKHRRRDRDTLCVCSPECYWQASRDGSHVRYPKGSNVAKAWKHYENKRIRAEGKELCRV